jgi:hypothetical protein
MSDYVDENGSPKSVTIRGAAAELYILWDQIMSGSVSLSTSQLTQMTLSFREFADRWPVLSSGILTPSNGLGTSNYGAAGADIGPLKLQIGTLSVAPLGASAKVTIEARALGGQRLKVNKDPSTLSNVSYTQWVRAKVESLGMTFVGEGTPVVAQVGNSNGQDSWTTIQKLAGDVGFIAFEAAGTFYFARPSWILARGKPVIADFSQVENPNDPLLELPTCQRDADSDKATIRARFKPGFDHMLPGDELIIKNIPTFNGSYIITGVDLDMSPDGAVSVSAETPVDPKPKATAVVQPPALANASALTSTTVRTAPVGTYGGERLNSNQLDVAARIVKVCQDRGVNPRAGLLSLMCAYQESRLRELTGGDRDSVGPFQQRPSQGWGTAAQCRRAEYSTNKFLDVLLKQKDWQTGTPTVVIANVQRPKKEYRNLYAQWQPLAQALLNATVVTQAATTSSPEATAITVGAKKLSMRPLNGSQTFQQIIDLASFGPSNVVTSTTGGGHSKTSYHYKGQAVDFGFPGNAQSGLRKIADFWSLYGKYAAEVIFYGQGTPVAYKNGSPYTYSSAIQSQHRTHVHIAFTEDGIRRMVAAGVASFR